MLPVLTILKRPWDFRQLDVWKKLCSTSVFGCAVGVDFEIPEYLFGQFGPSVFAKLGVLELLEWGACRLVLVLLLSLAGPWS